MADHLPLEDVQKHGELCPGGDLRIKRNRWLYDALVAAGKGRLLREGRMRTLVGCLNFSKHLCSSLSYPDEIMHALFTYMARNLVQVGVARAQARRMRQLIDGSRMKSPGWCEFCMQGSTCISPEI